MKLKWTPELLKLEALKYKHRGDFCKKSPSAYVIARNKGLLDKICPHMSLKFINWTKEKLVKEALKYKNRASFQKNSHSAYQTAYERNILDQICTHMEERYTFWTHESILKEALKYNTRLDFKQNSLAYNVAVKRSILEEVCTHMDPSKTKPRTLENLKLEALKYKTKGDFQKHSCGAYHSALKRGIIDEICEHMRMFGTISGSEIELFDFIKSIYPKTQKLRDKKVNLPDKKHIKGFDIDIYIPELRKGIEFDGTYHHSFDGLKRGRPKWPDHDLLNYHSLKDSHFLSKEIKILHIREQDWLEDKETCIKKCLEFLGSK